MKTYTTVIYTKDADNNQFWVGSLDESGVITEFCDVEFSRPLADNVGRQDLMHYVLIEEDGDNTNVSTIQSYMVASKTGRYHSVEEMAKHGIVNPLEVANIILDAHRLIGQKPN